MAQEYVITDVQLFILEIVVLQPDETRDEDVYIAAALYANLSICLWMCNRYLNPDWAD